MYPKELFLDIINYTNKSADCRAIEIGIGTGQATLPFLKSGYEVTALELGDNLAKFVKHKYSDYEKEAYEKVRSILKDDGIGGQINIYDTIDLYLGRK